MTVQLSKAQIEAIKVELAKVGLNVTVKRQAKSTAVSLKTWKPETPAGRACKSALIRWSKCPPIQGIKDYKVRGIDGQWYCESDGALFDAAVQYQRAWAANPESRRGMFSGNHR